MHRVARLAAVAVGAVILAFAAAGCRAAEVAPEAPRPASKAPVVVASFDFSESRLVAEIYAQALEAAGVPVRRERGLGPRELVQPALQQGLVDVVPEYLGTALAAVAPRSTADPHDAVAARRALDTALRPWKLRTLRPASASDQNALAVTRETARALTLHDVSDLRGQAPFLTFGSTPECASREYCLIGLRRVYGLQFGHVVPLASEQQRAAALEEGAVDVALLFTTDGAVAAGDLTLLADDQHLQPAENVVPVVSDRAVHRYGDRLTGTLDRVSTRLTTENLRFLNWRVEVAGRSISSEARGWLMRHGLITRSR